MDSMVSAYREMWSRWSDFGGRSSIGKYWWAVLFNFIVSLGAAVIAAVFGAVSSTLGNLVGVAFALYFLAIIVPFFALAIRRLHDTNRSGWWVLIGVVPLVGQITLIVFLASPGQPAPNQYGPPEMSGAINP